MSDNPDYILDLSNQKSDGQEPADLVADEHGDTSPHGEESSQSRKWVGVHFKCCDVYTRIWRNREGTAYVGACPRCQRTVRIRVGFSGVTGRFFEAS